FRKALDSGPDEVQLLISCFAYFEMENSLPKGGASPISPRLDFRSLRPLEVGFDDCLTERAPNSNIMLVYERAQPEIFFTADPLFGGVVLYSPPGKEFFAVEPVTNANDGFNLFDKGIPDSGVFVLEPGEQKAGTVQLKIYR